MQVAGELIERVEKAPDFSKDWGKNMRKWLEFRKGQPEDLAALWSNRSNSTPSTAPIVARVSKSDYGVAIDGFRSALALASFDRFDDAQEAYAEAMKDFGPAASADQRRDLRESYARWYLAKAHRREVEQMFADKGIPIPGTEHSRQKD